MSDALLEDLKKHIASRRAVLVIGSGVAIASTQDALAASWTGLLTLGVQRCVELDPTLSGDWHQRATADVTSPRIDDVLAGASKVRRTLERQGEWSRWLADTIGHLRVVHPELIAALGALEAPILTTNYDDLVERTLHRQSITWRDTVDQISFARLESSDTVLHLHGFWRKPESIILDVGDYQRVVGDPLTQTSLLTLGEAWSLVFIGCGDGLTDPNFEQFLDWMGKVLKGARHRHFRLERAEDVARRQQWHNDRGHRVRVLPYGEAYDQLPAFLRSLRGEAFPAAHVAATPSAEPPRTRPALPAGEYIRLQEKGRGAVRQLITLASQLGWTGIAAHGAELSEILKQEPYRVAVAGRSRAGKSTMLNALVGRAICPVAQVLTTAIPIIVGPGETETAIVTFEAGERAPVPFDSPITADMLAPYADQRYNPNNAKKVDRIEVRLGHHVLDLGVEYVDIPGFDDPSGRIWSSTSEIIRRAHALVLVVDVSTFATGGFAFDKSTRELMESAQLRACPVLVVCNKADRLTPSEQTAAAGHLQQELERFGLFAALPSPPFFLSAQSATEAHNRNETLPRPFAVFEEALWGQLWTTESIGLRRLHRVFDALRVVDEDATALIRARYAKAPERVLLQKTVARCQQEARAILAGSSRHTDELRSVADEAIERTRTEHLGRIAHYVATLGDPTLPSVSAAIEALQTELTRRCRNVLDTLAPTARSKYEEADKAISESLSRLREQVGVSDHAKQVRDTLATLSQWAQTVALPNSGSGPRAIKVLAAGGGTTASIGLFVGGPLGWLLGAGIGLGVSALVKHLTDHVDSREELQRRMDTHATEAFTSFGRTVDQAILSAGERLHRRIREWVQPFLNDMEQRLQTIREPTADELKLHAEMTATTTDAMALLTYVLNPHAVGAPADNCI